MGETKWTPEQIAAIELDSPLLVSAAAGSGKTAVLVERILKRILDGEIPVDVNQLLVVTFTKAAAAEMRERIRRSLDHELFNESDPSRVERLLRQLSLIPQANITTLHSFCLELLRKYYYLINFDPNFRVADDIEAALIRQDCIESIFERKYSEDNPQFTMLVEAFGSDRDDQPLIEHVLTMYDFASSQVSPKDWLEKLDQGYHWNSITDLIQSQWGQSALNSIGDSLDQAISQWESALEFSLNPIGPVEYAPVIEDELMDARQIREALRNNDWENAETLINKLAFTTLPRKRKNSSSRDEKLEQYLRDSAKSNREKAKIIIKKLQKEVFGWSLDEQIPKLKEMSMLVKNLAELVMEFSEHYAAIKRERRVVDYSDMEHLSIHLLTALDVSPDITRSLQHQFVEILVDEYQDINPAQERLLSLISQGGSRGNLFRVGDVKQSIYRFRMADPSLFIKVYNTFKRWNLNGRNNEDPSLNEGVVINLNRNFRSRKEIIDGVNFLFSQVMTQGAGEFTYDQDSALQYGASYLIQEKNMRTAHGPIELHLIDSTSLKDSNSQEVQEINSDGASDQNTLDREELDRIRLEARYMGQRILQMVGKGKSKEDSQPKKGEVEFYIQDKKNNNYRPLNFSDIVILMRSYTKNAPIFIEEFQKMNIPVYGETNTGYFEASEVEVMISLLKIIDNPHDDIPLAAVLRSPVVGLNGSELGRIRVLIPEGDFYETLALAFWISIRRELQIKPLETLDAIESEIKKVLAAYRSDWKRLLDNAEEVLKDSSKLQTKLIRFATQFYKWRSLAPFLKISDLIWKIYEDTGFNALVGCLPGGHQRQANLRILYDRACRFEGTHYRGLFRFLRFMEKYKNQNKDMGNARVLAENENVVRLMTVHASKGLEFPVVMMAGLGNKFNTQSLRGNLLLHNELGAGIPVFDLDNRVRYPSFIQYAVRSQLQRESLAEEMRILYVALTRAKERLILYGSVAKLEENIALWHTLKTSDPFLPDSVLGSAGSYLDWIGPALARHPGQLFKDCPGYLIADCSVSLLNDESQWKIIIYSRLPSSGQCDLAEESIPSSQKNQEEMVPDPSLLERIHYQLNWKYPYDVDHSFRAKTSVSELKSQFALHAAHESIAESPSRRYLNKSHSLQNNYQKPRFLQEDRIELSSIEKGIALHTACQHLPLNEWRPWFTWSDHERGERVNNYINVLERHGLISSTEAKGIEKEKIMTLLNGEIGQRLLATDKVMREIPFTLIINPKGNEASILVQGVIDALLIDGEHQEATIIDYKTDHVSKNHEPAQYFFERYGMQLKLYKLAVERLTRLNVKSCTIYSFDLERKIELLDLIEGVTIDHSILIG